MHPETGWLARGGVLRATAVLALIVLVPLVLFLSIGLGYGGTLQRLGDPFADPAVAAQCQTPSYHDVHVED